MSIIIMIIFGIAAGFIATKVMRLNVDLPTTVAIGVGGALIGGLVLRALSLLVGLLSGFVGAVLGAVLLIYVYKTYFAK
ncbi:MAG: GlsB/YeaQ/YmgE family stress response membrane protein [Cypionkella sp.]|nr:GlsB/YeaQ/YmgE family stress response membrane protein [Cypionkella sp.]